MNNHYNTDDENKALLNAVYKEESTYIGKLLYKPTHVEVIGFKDFLTGKLLDCELAHVMFSVYDGPVLVGYKRISKYNGVVH